MSNADAPDIVTVEIFGGRYPVRSGLDAEYVKRVAQYVDRKMHNAADQTRGGDTVRIAVLAALNIADEYFRLHEASTSGSDARRMTLELEQLIDTALTDETPPEDPA
ncbi:MAG: cell division protein ZapA [Acidobacteria bacterium]|nr:cell division protein ZapA [Acidobacteriota bacterium]